MNDGETGVMVKMQGIEKVDEYKYLGSAIQKAMGGLQKVENRVQAGWWSGWRQVSEMICDTKMQD